MITKASLWLLDSYGPHYRKKRINDSQSHTRSAKSRAGLRGWVAKGGGGGGGDTLREGPDFKVAQKDN